ncbi:MAG: hypothetical protein QW165_04915 [Candidatus Woesearchaeota archaeon]
MWNIWKNGNTTVYSQRSGERSYEIHYSDKIELIVMDAARFTTTYFRFDGNTARDYSQRVHDEMIVEKIVEELPELDTLPEKIVRALQSVKKKEAPELVEPTEPDL